MPVVTSYSSVGTVTLQNVPSPPAAGNNLATAAAALVPGSGASSYAAFNPSTLSVLVSADILDWCVRWHWDALNLRAWLMCKRAGTTGVPHKLFRYEASTDTFTKPYDAILTEGGASGSGHGYDNAALDPATGDFYFVPLSAENVLKWTGSSWVVATGNVTGGTGQASTARNITWHPNLYGVGDGGLVTARSSSVVRAWRKSTGSSGPWASIGSMPYTSVADTQGVYCTALDQAILSCGVTGLACLRVLSGPTVVRNVADFPVPCTANADQGDTNMSRLVQTPSGSVGILESSDAARVWRLNTSTFAWELQSFTHPMRTTSNTTSLSSWPTMFVSTYGVYWALREQNGGNSNPSSILWRPPVGF